MNKNIDIYVKFQLDKITGIFEKFSQHGEGGGLPKTFLIIKIALQSPLNEGSPKGGSTI